MSVLDYLLTGIMFALFSGNLKLAAINLRESGNFKVAAICNAGGAFADFVAFCSVINAVSTYAASKADNKSSKNKKYRNNKRGAVRVSGNDTDSTNTSDFNNTDAGNSIGNSVPIEGKGSTGRTTPNNINEQVAMQQVRSNPLDGAVDLSKVSKKPVILRDGRWKASDGWVKMSNTVNGIEIHFVYNTITGAFDDFKFV